MGNLVAAVSSDMIPGSCVNPRLQPPVVCAVPQHFMFVGAWLLCDYYTWPEVEPRHKSVAGAVQRLDLVMRCECNIHDSVRSCVQDSGDELQSTKQSYATVLDQPYQS